MRRPRLISLAAAAVLLATPLAAIADNPVGSDATTPLLGQGCDDTDPAQCLLPFPNDRFTVADERTVTGKRVAIPLLGTPRNVAGKPVDVSDQNRADGFSPGSPILTLVPGLDPVQSRIPGIRDLDASLAPDASIVLLNAETGERHPFWAELDSNDTGGEEPVLIVRPARNLDEATRYVVALRGMKDAAGRVIPSSPAFAEARRAYVKKSRSKGQGKAKPSVFGDLAAAGVDPASLFLAWDFTVASAESLTGRMLHVRDDAFSALGDAAPGFAVTEVVETPGEPVVRTVKGSLTVPSYLNLPGGVPGSRFLYADPTDPDARPTRNPVDQARVTFTCRIPAAALDTPSRISLYGHGLLGGQGEVGAGNVTAMAAENDITFCATDWQGMATEDVPNVATILADMSNFSSLADRVQQGMLNFLFLGRAMSHEAGFAADPAFRGPDGAPLIDPSELFYDGNSQGGIIGGALVAVSQDVRRAVLGVPGMNYSTLLDRSVDFDGYEQAFRVAYPSELDRQIIFALIQMLWDRAESNGYAHHMTDDPLPGTPEHAVLLHVAFGDHQVANVAAEVMARTIGADLHTPALREGRHWDVSGQPWGFAPAGAGSHSALVYWDSGSDTPPDGNIPPTAATEHGDPHGDPRSTRAARDQKSAWLRTGGGFVDTCAGAPCLARPLAPAS